MKLLEFVKFKILDAFFRPAFRSVIIFYNYEKSFFNVPYPYGDLTAMALQNFNLINHKMLIALIVLVSFLFCEKVICQCTNVHTNINYTITRILVYSRFSNSTWNSLHFCDKFIITDIIYGLNYVLLLVVMVKTFRPLYSSAFFFRFCPSGLH